jgi:hypothetical protein
MTYESVSAETADTFNADMARAWLEIAESDKKVAAKQWLRESVIPYIRDACAKLQVYVTLPPCDHTTALHVLNMLEERGFRVEKDLGASTTDTTVLTVLWKDKKDS